MSPYKINQAVVSAEKLSYVRVLKNPCESQDQNQNPLSPLRGSLWSSILTDSAAQDFAVFLRLKDLEKPGRFGTFDADAVEKIIQDIKTQIPFQVWFTGSSAQQLYMMKGMAQSQILNLAVIFIIWVSFRFLFGTWRSGAIFLFTLLFANTIVFGLMGFLGYAIDPLSSCLFLMIAVSSLEDFVFISYEQMKNTESYKRSFRKMMTVSFFTSLTTLLGFGSLVISDLQSLRHFGGLAALGSLLEWVGIFLVLPSWMVLFPSWQKWVRPEKAWFYKVSYGALKKTPPRWLIQMSLLVFIAAGFSVQQFHFSQTPSETFPAEHPFQQGIEYIKKTRGWVADASLVFEPHVSEDIKNHVLSVIQQDPLVVQIENYDDVEKFVSRGISKAAVLTQKMVSFDLAQSDFAKRYHAESKETRAILYLKTTETEKINLLRDKVKALCAHNECWLAGEYIGFADFSKALITTLFDSLFMSLVLVALVIFYLTRATQKKYFWAIIMSALWGPAWMLVAIYSFDLSINFITCIVASTLIGLTGDNAIQYMFEGHNLQQGIENRGVGSIQCTVVMILCCLTFLGSYFEPVRMLGLLLAGGFMVSLLGDVWVLKSLIHKHKT